MKRLVSKSGFTIVEVSIVLAVVGVIAAATLPFISGKQSSTQYTIGINQIQSQISSVINNMSTGNIPVNKGFTCTSDSNGPKISATSGSNTGACQFLGEAVYFKQNSMLIIPVVGIRSVGDTLVQNLTAAKPCPMLVGGTGSCSAFDGSSSYSYTNGIVLSKYNNSKISSTTGSDTYGGLFLFLTSSVLANSAQQNGSISMDSVNLGIKDPGDNSSNIFDKIKNIGTIDISTFNNSTDLCFYNSATNQHGTITLSANGSPSEVSLNNGSGAC